MNKEQNSKYENKDNIDDIIKQKSKEYGITINGDNCGMDKGELLHYSNSECSYYEEYACGGSYSYGFGDVPGCRFHDSDWYCFSCKNKEGRLNRLNEEINKIEKHKKELK